MLTYDQAVYFLEEVLRMPPSWRDLLQQKPLEFLTLYLKRHAIRVPFQNFDMAAVEEGHRWFPSEEEIANVGLSGRGGCCLHLNYFTKLVFQALGMDTFVTRGDHFCAPVPGSHCMVMVRLHGPKDTGVYMIEVGGAYPMLEPVPMDKEKLPYKTLQAGGYPYEFREIGLGWIGKFHIGGGILGGAFKDKKETLRTCWEMKPRSLWEFDYSMLETFTKPCYSTMLRGPFLYRFFSNTEFCRLFPELPENAKANQKEKVLVSKPKPIPKISKVVAASKTKVPETKIIGGLVSATNGKAQSTNGKAQSTNGIAQSTNGKAQSTNGKPASVQAVNGKSSLSGSPNTNGKTAPTTTDKKTVSDIIITNLKSNGKTPVLEDSDEEEFEMVTEEDIESEDDLDDPKNFIFAYQRRVVVGDAHSRKVIKNYDTYEQMALDLKLYFPKIPSKVVDKAIETFSAYEPKPSLYDAIL